MQPIEHYLANYAEPEARLGLLEFGHYARCLVVPVCREAPEFLTGYVAALDAAPGRTLLIVVVNNSSDASCATRDQNRMLLQALSATAEQSTLLHTAPTLRLLRHTGFDILLIDRSSAGFELPAKQGVGLARKIGADVALRCYERGLVQDAWIFFSDADVELPPSYFGATAGAPQQAAALVFPFSHHSQVERALPAEPPSQELDTATELYEISLRYYVLGLRFAGSPYAFHTIGSTLAVRADAYARVRGVPRRLAAEDFYLLDKLAKVGGIWCPNVPALRIEPRLSDRVPFGTGRGVIRLLTEPLTLYPPPAFDALRAWLRRLDEFAAAPSAHLLQQPLALSAELARVTSEILSAAGAPVALEAAARQASPGAVLRRRLHTWFDAFRTLKFIHALRDAHLPVPVWWQVLSAADFIPGEFCSTDRAQALRQMRLLEDATRGLKLGPAGAAAAPADSELFGPAVR